MISAKCKFNGVGQGLFYSASISDGHSRVFNFVYDCGTFYDKDKKLLNEKISNCFSEDTIDALFISHFHKDHISGISELIKKYKIKLVFLPFFTKEELILLRKKYGWEAGDELYDFYSDPSEYFVGRAERIYVISGNNNNDNDNNYHSLEHDEIFGNSDEENGFHIRTRVEDITTNKQGTPVIKCSDVSIKLYSPSWHFKIYQDQDNATQLRIKDTIIEEYRKEFGEEFTEDSVSAITDTDKIKLCKDIYNKVKFGINQSSLVLCHYPDKYINCYTLFDSKYCCNCRCGCCCWYCFSNNKDNVATLLTGDINMNCLSDNKNKFKEFLKSVPVKIGYFQLPHHGSGNNSSVDTITSLSLQNTNMICSYRRKNQFKHPDPFLLYKLNTCCNHIFHVNNDESFVYQIIEDK